LSAVQIRACAITDAPLLAALHAQGFTTPWRTQDIGELLASPGVLALAACLHDAPAGFIMVRTCADEVEILTLATAPGYRRRGAAKALLAAGIARAREGGARRMFLEVSGENAAAAALYAGAGFEEIARRKGYYRDGSDARVLARGLE